MTTENLSLAIETLTRALCELHAGRFDHAAAALNAASGYATKAAEDAGFRFVPQQRAGALADAFAKLAKRSAKLGQEAPGLVTHGVDYRRVGIGDGRSRVVGYVMVSVDGAAPVVEGAKLLARVEHTAAGNIVSCAPGVAEDPAWRSVDTRCEHCGTRRNRIDTFAVAVDGAVKMIGRNCLADFVRSADVEAALQLWRFLHLVTEAAGCGEDDWGCSGGWSHVGPTPVHFVACAARAIRQVGYVKRGAEGQSTMDAAAFACGPRPTMSPGSAKDWDDAQPEECDAELAVRALAWLAGTTDGGFLANCRVVAALPFLKVRHMGVAAAIALAYRKDQERAALDAERAARKAERDANRPADAGHFGEVGKRYDLAGLKVVMVRSWAGEYGTTTLVKMTDAAGHRFAWFASGEKTYEAGQVLAGRATVKKHETSEKFGTETVLTRGDLAAARVAA